MKHCIRLFLLIIPSLIALGLLGVSFGANWWMKTLEKNIPEENSLHVTNDTKIHSILIPITISHGLLSECISYRNIKVLILNSYNFREEYSLDEQIKLSNTTCLNNQFLCEKGPAISRPIIRCIDQREKCNRIINCEDKSDELSCNKNFQISDCPNGHVECPDRRTCYRKDEQTCDGVSHCIDDSDEMNCNEYKCELNRHVYCPREKKCARRENSYRCDGIPDCYDNSDEENCQDCLGNTNAFLCDSKCFLPKYRCNGIVDCSDFRDELNCGEYSGITNPQEIIYHRNGLCQLKRFNPFDIYPPKSDSSINLYPKPKQRQDYLNAIYYLRLAVFYGITGGLIFISFSMISLFFFACCRQKCIGVPFYFYGLWTLLSWIFICIGLISFVIIWFLKKEILLDDEENLQFDTMIYRINPSLQYLEFFGLSFWLACGAALATFIGLLLSCCICCTIGSSRSDNKEYEIMQMQNY